jgi:hypothetical protein
MMINSTRSDDKWINRNNTTATSDNKWAKQAHSCMYAL